MSHFTVERATTKTKDPLNTEQLLIPMELYQGRNISFREPEKALVVRTQEGNFYPLEPLIDRVYDFWNSVIKKKKGINEMIKEINASYTGR